MAGIFETQAKIINSLKHENQRIDNLLMLFEHQFSTTIDEDIFNECKEHFEEASNSVTIAIQNLSEI